MAEYMLILHENAEEFVELSAEEIQKVIEEYVAWSDNLAAEGKLINGKKLKDEGGKLLSLKDGNLRVTDGPFTEAKEVVAGYFIILADNYDEAVNISESCPHLKYGGKIELREIEPTE